MRSEIIPEGDEFRHPLFVSPLPFLYRMIYRDTRRSNNVITYTTPHEIILNLHCFRDDDKITYINRDNNQEVFTITVDRFKVMLAESLYNVSHDDLELLYMRLILTNRYSKSIADKGQFRQMDTVLRRYLVSIKGGYDSYLSYENRKVILYFKYRRMSPIHLLAVLDYWNTQNPDININHINTPIVSNQGLLYECLRVELTKERFRMYHYDPVDEDNILPTKIDSEIIQVINQLIK
ncbi:MAG: hypothetical protein JNJ75_04550 [Cyclobacteriaceae bacterium]|nr:hypothetical protein [Cyclobacteriaceae bacterium]